MVPPKPGLSVENGERLCHALIGKLLGLAGIGQLRNILRRQYDAAGNRLNFGVQILCNLICSTGIELPLVAHFGVLMESLNETEGVEIVDGNRRQKKVMFVLVELEDGKEYLASSRSSAPSGFCVASGGETFFSVITRLQWGMGIG